MTTTLQNQNVREIENITQRQIMQQTKATKRSNEYNLHSTIGTWLYLKVERVYP